MADAQLWFEDLAVGTRFDGEAHELDESAFTAFAKMTGDAHPLHYDAEYAKTTRFGKPLAHGLLLVSMTALGATKFSERLHDSMVAFLEEGFRFLKPVFPGDVVRPRFEVKEASAREGSSSGRVRIAVRLENQHGEAVAEGFHEYLVRRRSAG